MASLPQICWGSPLAKAGQNQKWRRPLDSICRFQLPRTEWSGEAWIWKGKWKISSLYPKLLFSCCHLPTFYSLSTWTPRSLTSSLPLSDFSIHVGVFFIHSYNHSLNTTTSSNTILTSSISLPEPHLLSNSLTSSFIVIFQPSLGLDPATSHSPTIHPHSLLHSPVSPSSMSRGDTMGLTPLKIIISNVFTCQKSKFG